VDVPVSIATCVSESRDCRACVPAAKFFVDQVRQGRAREQARNAYRLRFDPALVKTLDLSGSPSKGPAAARVTIVEWADFQCPFCAEAAPMIESARSAHTSDVRLVFKHFPLDRHAHAVDAARAGVAAELQGKFWPMHEKLYAQHGQIDRSLVLQLAAEVGLDTAELQRDMEDAATVASIERDKRQADALGLKGTPLIYINGRHFDLDYFDLSTDLLPWVELELELTKPVGG
jgi:protein-disulfide isomerase